MSLFFQKQKMTKWAGEGGRGRERERERTAAVVVDVATFEDGDEREGRWYDEHGETHEDVGRKDLSIYVLAQCL